MANKKYKKGMTDAAKAYFDFGSKQEQVLEHILHEVSERNDILDKNITNLYEYLLSSEKQKLYSIYTPIDVADLDCEEKLLLVGILYKLTQDKVPTEAQQRFIRSIQHYLNIKESPLGVNISAIEKIESMNAQKAIYQVVLEYLMLQEGDSYDETEIQHDLLDSFNLNNKNRQTIAEHVRLLYIATGAEGFVEKYGFSANEESLFSSDLQNKIIESKAEIEKAIKRLDRDIIVLPYPSLYDPDSDILFDDYISKEACVVAIGGELKKEYDSAAILLNRYSSNSIAKQAYEEMKETISPILEDIRHSMMLLLEIIDIDELKNESFDFLNLSEYQNSISEALDRELQDKYYTLPPVSTYASKIEFESDDLELETGFFKRLLEKIAAKWSASGYPYGEIQNDIYQLVQTYEKVANRIIRELLVDKVKNHVEEYITKTMVAYQ